MQVIFLRFYRNSNLAHHIRAYTHHLKMCRWNLKWPSQVDFLNICDRSRPNSLGIWHGFPDTFNLHNVVFSFRVNLSSKRTNFRDLSAIFLNFPEFSQISKIPWPISKFPDFSLTLNFPDFSLTSGNPVKGLRQHITKTKSCVFFCPVCPVEICQFLKKTYFI